MGEGTLRGPAADRLGTEAPSAAGRAAIATWLVAAALTLAATILAAGQGDTTDTVLYGLLTIALATSGCVIVWRRPRQRIGRLFCCLALYLGVTELAEAYGLRAAGTDLPAGAVGEWIIAWSWLGEMALWSLVFVLFPDGRLPTPRWRIVPWIACAGCALAIPGYAFGAGSGDDFAGGVNPYAVESPVFELLFYAGSLLLTAALVASVVSLVLRLRRARGVERQQLKWFAFAAAFVALVFPFAIAFWGDTVVVEILIALGFIGLPTAAGVAILRHRLYDIDVVINRTLVYGALTATLAGTYLGSVLLLQLVLSGVTANDGLAIAASTLAVAALFRPARGRIQAAVDRRFYRRKYDAARTLAGFGAHLRDEVDLDALGAELRAVVGATMQPAHVSLWLRAPERSR